LVDLLKTAESYEFTGVWPGKTIKDWKEDLVERIKTKPSEMEA